jgi:hypothetical protein
MSVGGLERGRSNSSIADPFSAEHAGRGRGCGRLRKERKESRLICLSDAYICTSNLTN